MGLSTPRYEDLDAETREFIERTPQASSGFEYAYWCHEGRGAFVFSHEDVKPGTKREEFFRLDLTPRKRREVEPQEETIDAESHDRNEAREA